MLLLMVFALVAGAGTAITPCVLPVLPAILSASAAGGRRRPLGIVLGLGVAFAVAIVVLASLERGVGVSAGAARTVAIVVLLGFGAILLVPELAARIEAPLSRLARFGPRTRGTGFWSGLPVGAALGFVCAPCAGPILAAVIQVSASGRTSLRSVLVALAYTAGLALVLLVYAFAGRAALTRLRRALRGHVVERGLGVVLIATGVVMLTNLDIRFENDLANDTSLPAALRDPTQSLENSHAVRSRLASLRPASRFAQREAHAHATAVGTEAASVAIPGVATPKLADLGAAPNFTKTEDWFNTPGGRPLSLSALRGHVVLVDFWTYTCINCLRTLPFLKGLYAHYHRYGLEVVGVETPEFTFEQEASNVRHAIAVDGIRYPVVQDNRYGTWNAYQNEYWPAEYLIDPRGDVRHTQFGEGDYKQDEAAVRALLYAAGAHHLPPPMTAHATLPSTGLATEETYLDPERADAPGEHLAQPLVAGTRFYPGVGDPDLNEFGLHGIWTASSQSVTPAGPGTTINGRFQAAHVYLVMTSQGNRPRRVRVLLDGRAIPAGQAGADVGRGGWVTVRGERLYALVAEKTDVMATITLQVPRGVAAYDFTFG